MSLKWKEIAELTGLVAILVGMFFVYTEIQQNSTIARAELSAANFQRLAELRDKLLDTEFSDMYEKGVRTPEALNASERQVLKQYYGSFIWVLVAEYQNYNLGIFAEYDQMGRILARQQFHRGYGRAYWNAVKDRLDPNVANVVNQELANIDAGNAEADIDQEILRQIEAL